MNTNQYIHTTGIYIVHTPKYKYKVKYKFVVKKTNKNKYHLTLLPNTHTPHFTLLTTEEPRGDRMVLNFDLKVNKFF